MSASQKAGALASLDPKKWADKVRDYIVAKATKKEADAASRAADSTIKSIRGQLREAMNGNLAVKCGNAILTIRTTAPAEASITLTDGGKIPWNSVTAIVVGNRHIIRSDVQSLYGGRSGSEDVECAGQP